MPICFHFTTLCLVSAILTILTILTLTILTIAMPGIASIAKGTPALRKEFAELGHSSVDGLRWLQRLPAVHSSCCHNPSSKPLPMCSVSSPLTWTS